MLQIDKLITLLTTTRKYRDYERSHGLSIKMQPSSGLLGAERDHEVKF